MLLPAYAHLPCLLFSCLQNYFDNRYWTMWKLPMFGCTDPVQVRTICSSFVHHVVPAAVSGAIEQLQYLASTYV